MVKGDQGGCTTSCGQAACHHSEGTQHRQRGDPSWHSLPPVASNWWSRQPCFRVVGVLSTNRSRGEDDRLQARAYQRFRYSCKKINIYANAPHKGTKHSYIRRALHIWKIPWLHKEFRCEEMSDSLLESWANAKW